MSYIHGVYVADGFADDCDELMQRCQKVKQSTLTFERFSDIWKEMQMSCIFQGRSSGAEMAELSEEVLHIAKQYLVADTGNFEESVAGLFLVYSLMHLQPYKNFASLRVIQDDIPALQRIELVARRNRRLDVLYVLGSVLIQGPVQYHAAVRERGMEFPIRKYLEGYTTIDKIDVRPKGVFYRQNTELDLMKEINHHSVRYIACKENISDERNDRNLKYFDPMSLTQLDVSLKNIISGIVPYDNDEESNTDRDTIKNIKKKAMASQVKPIRHRVGVYTKMPDKYKELEPSTSKNIAKGPRGDKRDQKSSDFSEDSNCTDLENLTLNDTVSDDDIDITKFKKSVTSTKYQINADSSEIGKTYEIEFIDHFNQPSTSGLNSKTCTVSSGLNSKTCTATSGLNSKTCTVTSGLSSKTCTATSGLNSKPCTATSGLSTKTCTVTSGLDSESCIATSGLDSESCTVTSGLDSESCTATSGLDSESLIDADTHKRDLKKTIVKSRFKRMGMLPVANFEGQ